MTTQIRLNPASTRDVICGTSRGSRWVLPGRSSSHSSAVCRRSNPVGAHGSTAYCDPMPPSRRIEPPGRVGFFNAYEPRGQPSRRQGTGAVVGWDGPSPWRASWVKRRIAVAALCIPSHARAQRPTRPRARDRGEGGRAREGRPAASLSS